MPGFREVEGDEGLISRGKWGGGRAIIEKVSGLKFDWIEGIRIAAAGSSSGATTLRAAICNVWHYLSAASGFHLNVAAVPHAANRDFKLWRAQGD